MSASLSHPHMFWEQGYLWKKGHLRRNWSERWFTLKPTDLSYHMSEERKEKKGSISLDRNSCVEVIGHPVIQREQEKLGLATIYSNGYKNSSPYCEEDILQ